MDGRSAPGPHGSIPRPSELRGHMDDFLRQTSFLSATARAPGPSGVPGITEASRLPNGRLVRKGGYVEVGPRGGLFRVIGSHKRYLTEAQAHQCAEEGYVTGLESSVCQRVHHAQDSNAYPADMHPARPRPRRRGSLKGVPKSRYGGYFVNENPPPPPRPRPPPPQAPLPQRHRGGQQRIAEGGRGVPVARPRRR